MRATTSFIHSHSDLPFSLLYVNVSQFSNSCYLLICAWVLKTSVSLFPESVGSQRDCLLSSNSRKGQVGRGEVCFTWPADLVRIPDLRVAGRYTYLHYI